MLPSVGDVLSAIKAVSDRVELVKQNQKELKALTTQCKSLVDALQGSRPDSASASAVHFNNALSKVENYVGRIDALVAKHLDRKVHSQALKAGTIQTEIQEIHAALSVCAFQFTIQGIGSIHSSIQEQTESLLRTFHAMQAEIQAQRAIATHNPPTQGVQQSSMLQTNLLRVATPVDSPVPVKMSPHNLFTTPDNTHRLSPGGSNTRGRGVIPATKTSPRPEFWARALWNYKGESEGDLYFSAGDVVCVLKEENGDWWKGQIGHRLGLFPRNYVQRIEDPRPSPRPDPMSRPAGSSLDKQEDVIIEATFRKGELMCDKGDVIFTAEGWQLDDDIRFASRANSLDSVKVESDFSHRMICKRNNEADIILRFSLESASITRAESSMEPGKGGRALAMPQVIKVTFSGHTREAEMTAAEWYKYILGHNQGEKHLMPPGASESDLAMLVAGQVKFEHGTMLERQFTVQPLYKGQPAAWKSRWRDCRIHQCGILSGGADVTANIRIRRPGFAVDEWIVLTVVDRTVLRIWGMGDADDATCELKETYETLEKARGAFQAEFILLRTLSSEQPRP